jgi:hypothetical protein
MDRLHDWEHRWFGFWSEYGPSFSRCPSIREFLRPRSGGSYDCNAVATYLSTAHVIMSTSRMAWPNPFGLSARPTSLSMRTDGVWVWPDDLAEQVEELGVALPTSLLEHMARNGFRPPGVSEQQIQELEWPT